MTETLQHQEALMTQREVLESQTPQQLVELKREALSKLSDLETLVHDINDVLEGYGCPVEIIG